MSTERNEVKPERNWFKNESGTFYTLGLFFETCGADKSSVLYTLKPEDHQGYASLKRLYIEMQDPTEYEFANAHLGGWEHWTKLSNAPWFQPYITSWRNELELLLKAKAYRAIAVEASGDGKNAFMANKYLLENLRKLRDGDESKAGRGRPSNDEIKRTALEIVSKDLSVDEDLQRIRLVQ